MGETRTVIFALRGNLIVPLQGEIDDQQAEDLSEDVLRSIAEQAAASLVLDVTGISVIDSHFCAVLGRLATAASLMGTACLVVGMRPAIAMTLQEMGLELPGIRTALNLEDALVELGILGPALAEGDREHAGGSTLWAELGLSDLEVEADVATTVLEPTDSQQKQEVSS